VSVHAPHAILNAACLAFNSMIATYYLQLASGRTAAYRPEALISEIRDLPVPADSQVEISDAMSLAEIDTEMFKAFAFKDAERVLVEDMFNYVVPAFRGDSAAPGYARTSSTDDGSPETLLAEYCHYFIRVLKAGFGQDRSIHATIFQSDRAHAPLPYRLVSFELGDRETDGPNISVRTISTTAMVSQMEKLDLGPGRKRRGMYGRRIARVYDGSSGIPTIFVLKPDMARFWTRSIAIEDGDEVALDLFRWQQSMSEEVIAQ
jgi:hypothetical protein